MNHEHEQNRTGSTSPELAHSDTNSVEPGQSSRSALLRKPNQAVASGLVQHTDPSGADSVQGAPESGTGPSASSGAAGTGAGTTTDMVETHWLIDYERIYTGAVNSGRRAPGERNESSVLPVREFRVRPADVTAPPTVFTGYHLQNSGAVDMGTVQHPRNQGGVASASISYMRDQDFRLSAIGGDPATVRGFGGRELIERRASEALSRHDQFCDDLATVATGLLSNRERDAGIVITVRPAPRSSETESIAIASSYPAISDVRAMDFVVEVPVGERRMTTESTSGGETVTAGSHTSGTTHEASREDESATRDARSLMNSVSHQFQLAREEIATRVTQEILNRRLSFEQQFELGGEATAGLTGELSANITLGDLLLLIPEARPLSALLRDVGPEIDLALTPNLQLLVSARSVSTGAMEATTEQSSTDESSLRRAITQALSSSWEQRFEREVSRTIRRRTTDGASSVDLHSGRSVARHGAVTRSEGVRVTQLDIPRLVLRR